MLNKQKILIVEDEAVIAEHLKIILENSGIEHIELAYDKENALVTLSNFQPDLVLLDIHMKNEFDGIEIAEYLNLNQPTPFIFITAHSDATIINKATKTKPIAYITKPFKQADIYAAINIASHNLKKKETTISFKDGYDDVFLNVDSILYVKSEKNYIDIVCLNKKHSIRNSLDWFLEKVSNSDFMRIHRSYIINTNQIQKLSSSAVFIKDFTIPISRKYISSLRQKIQK
ncbi:MAG: response regulator transcription factor [Flavobacteriales bacterium]|nr:response regulator transcription factor [Flavobacteriales bacterium]